MSKMLMLAKVLLKTNFKLNKKSIALGLVVVLSLLPVTALIWSAAWEGYDIMAGVGQQGLILWMALLVSLPCIFFINYAGILIDLKFPKLDWDNEQKAVKQNLNGMLAMLISIAFGAVNFGLVIYLKLDYIYAFVVIFCFYILADLLLYKLASGYGTKLFKEL